MIGYLRKNFPSTVSSDTVKKFSLAPNNESFVINALQFIGVIDEAGKRTEEGHKIFVLADDAFAVAFGDLIQNAYKDLFDLRGSEAWTLSRNDLASYFRTADKTSEVIGNRQAGLFQAFASLAGHAPGNDKPSQNGASKARAPRVRIKAQKKSASDSIPAAPQTETPPNNASSERNFSMTVRIEVNLPSNGSQDTYDAIFRSIRANLIND